MADLPSPSPGGPEAEVRRLREQLSRERRAKRWGLGRAAGLGLALLLVVAAICYVLYLALSFLGNIRP
jgi:hypothetical protein